MNDLLMPWEEPEYLAEMEQKKTVKKCYRYGCDNNAIAESAFCSEECRNLEMATTKRDHSIEEMQKQLLQWGREARNDTFVDMVQDTLLTK